MKKHPIPLTCEKCGGRLKFKRFEKDGKRYRKYYCPNCGFAQTFQRERDAYF